MSNKKQTAIDFAVEKLEKLIPSGHQIIISIILEKAKEMDKQQKIEAYNQGYRDCENDASNIHLSIGDIEEYSNAEDYYKETYETSN